MARMEFSDGHVVALSIFPTAGTRREQVELIPVLAAAASKSRRMERMSTHCRNVLEASSISTVRVCQRMDNGIIQSRR